MTRLQVDKLKICVDEGPIRRAVISDLTLGFERGQMTCVTGPSGSGKTTLLSALSLLINPDGGDIRYGDKSLVSLSVTEKETFRRQNIGLVFQTLRLIEVFTVEQHIDYVARRFPTTREVKHFAYELLEQSGMGDKLNALPRSLSGGEKQRAALAITLCSKPNIVLADEPTASLDERNSIFVADTLARYAENGAVVVCVSHDPILFGKAHKVSELIRPN